MKVRRMIGTFVVALALIAGGSASTAQAKTEVPSAATQTPAHAMAANGPLCNPYAACTSLKVGTPAWTGKYKAVVSGPHVTQVKVYTRTYQACRLTVGAGTFTCFEGIIVYAPGFAACFNGCTVAGMRGSQTCHTHVTTMPGFKLTTTGCRNHLMTTGVSAGYGSVAVEMDDVCAEVLHVGVCKGAEWHINAYGSGNITGVYNGLGIA